MKRALLVLVLVSLSLPGSVALAQSTRENTVSVVVQTPATDETPVSTETPVVTDENSVTALGLTFSLDPNCLLEGIVVGTNNDLKAKTVKIRPFENTVDGWESLPAFEGKATGDFANASVGDQSCLMPKGK